MNKAQRWIGIHCKVFLLIEIDILVSAIPKCLVYICMSMVDDEPNALVPDVYPSEASVSIREYISNVRLIDSF